MTFGSGIHVHLWMNLNNSGEPLTFYWAIITLAYDQIPAKITMLPSASAVLYVLCQSANVSMLTHKS